MRKSGETCAVAEAVAEASYITSKGYLSNKKVLLKQQVLIIWKEFEIEFRNFVTLLL